MKTEPFRILALGDVSRPSACEYLRKNLWNYRKENGVSFTVVNGENSAEGNGIDFVSAGLLFDAGADIITTGNHAFKRYEAKRLFDEDPLVLRPANFPPEVPGDGAKIMEIEGLRILVLNLLGVIMLEPLENPFFAARRLLKRYEGRYDLSVLDFHAEATSEKQALAYELDGSLTLFFGTHTHVTTADEQLLPRGTAYITDVGMCGPQQSVIGIRPDCIIEKMKTGLPVKFIPSENPVTAHGVLVEVDRETKKATKITRISF